MRRDFVRGDEFTVDDDGAGRVEVRSAPEDAHTVEHCALRLAHELVAPVDGRVD